MNDLNQKMETELLRFGADIVGFADLRELPDDVREGLPFGISIAVVYPKEVIRGIKELPTLEYREWYDKLNEKLDATVTHGAEMLGEMGYKAIAKTRKYIGGWDDEIRTLLPHKTVATRAGIGWIGKSALLVTGKYGSAIRVSTILTDAPFVTATPVNESRCGAGCMICANACPTGVISGKLWEAGMERHELFDAEKCLKTVKERSRLGFNEDATICGKCIEICPHTQRYIYETR